MRMGRRRGWREEKEAPTAIVNSVLPECEYWYISVLVNAVKD